MADLALPTLGVDWLSDEYNLPEGAVRVARNVDLRRNGTFRRRDGYTQAIAGDGFHGLANTSRGVLVARFGRLFALDVPTMEPTQLIDLGSESPVDFTEHNGDVYAINDTGFAWIPGDADTARPVGVLPPLAIPGLEAADTGALVPGEYAVAISRLDDRGEESPTVYCGRVSTGAGIRLVGMAPDLGAQLRVYLTAPGGEVLYLAETFSAAFTTYVVTRQPDGAQRTSQHMAPLPGGQFVRGHAGRLYVARDNLLLFSDALRPRLYDPRHNFIRFTGPIRLLEPVTGGLFVGDDRGVWFLPGNEHAQFSLSLASKAQAVARSSVIVSGKDVNKEWVSSDQKVAMWLSADGYMLGRSDGAVVPLTAERVRVAADMQGRTVFVARNGIKQVITLVAATAPSGFGVASDSPLQ
ncbi:MAG: hypothetical protein ACKOWC_03950 [Limnohabitans sp.]